MMVRAGWLRMVVGAAALAFAAAAFAQSIQLRHRYRQGERLRYQVALKSNGTISSPTLGQTGPFEMSGSLKYVRDVQKVEGSGNATIHTVVEDSSIDAMWRGQPLPVTLDLPPITAKVSPSGKILSCTAAAPASQQLPSMGLSGPGAATQAFDLTKFFGTTQSAGFPRQPVAPGSEWSDSATITTAEGAKIKVSTTSKLLGIVNYRGRQCAKIRTAFSVPLSMQMAQMGIPFVLTGSEQGTVTTYFAVAEGRMIGTVGKVQTDMTMGTGMPAMGTGQSVAVTMKTETDVRVSLAGTGSASRSR